MNHDDLANYSHTEINELRRELAEAKAERDALKAEVERMEERERIVLAPSYVEPLANGDALVMTELVKQHVFGLRANLAATNRRASTMSAQLDAWDSQWANSEVRKGQLEADLTRLRAIADELAGALEQCRDAFVVLACDRDTRTGMAAIATDTALAHFRDAANPASARTPPGTNERSGDE